ncbi:hypothetical protein LZF95_15350 [Algoriphagus sp. AGSA1]|uniref:hypothetical protein n=1 Tax=Algoriphagus sp. AGSA1 TaxID=2907213 RepID=UPI001F3C395E|nr:hypothetical protein [Algoriphagus sp. AGSA1]MCE7056057.1 hypothetical protein [Algoriphagus sp. AGSA1]
MKKIDRITSFFPFVPLPTTILGTYTMIYFDVPISIWSLNLSIVCVGVFIALFFLKKPVPLKDINPIIVLATSMILLLGTFYDEGIMNVHRWINIKSLQINIGLIASPLLLIQISRVTSHTFAIVSSVIVIIIFSLQPDSSLVSAFSISVCIILFRNHKSKLVNISFFLFALISIGYSWYHLDNLEPVSHVEEIVDLTKRISKTLFFVSVISLLLLVIPFVYDYPKKDDMSVSLGIYYLIILLATFLGHFPVMLMGYGISPIIGYFIGLIWKINTNTKTEGTTKEDMVNNNTSQNRVDSSNGSVL